MKMNEKKKGSRRRFLKTAAVSSAGFMIVPRHVIGKGFVAPSDKLNVAGIGAGGKGRSDLSSFVKGGNVNVVAFGMGMANKAAKSGKTNRRRNNTKISGKIRKKKKEIMKTGPLLTRDITNLLPPLTPIHPEN